IDRANCLIEARGETNLEDAQRDARCARDTFRSLGASRDAERAEALLATLEPSAERAKSKTRGPTVTARQLEILRLIAKGLPNAQIAKRLKLSDHTVKRH